MDFCNAGATERAGDAFRAHINWTLNGKQQNAYGPRRPDEESAKDDLASMRAAASGMGRRDGFAAMAIEADRLKAGKLPKEEGSIETSGLGFRARIRWFDGRECQANGPRRYEHQRAREDLQTVREAVSKRRAAIAVEARRLQQQADTERRVAVFAHHRVQEQQGLAQQQDLRAAQHHHQQAEEAPDDQSDWEIDDDS